MNSLFRPRSHSFRFTIGFQALFAAMFVAFSVTSLAQQPQLTLADILIGLRSKKVSLEDRNNILAAAVKERGITFAASPEIEKELEATGATKVLLDAVNERAAAVAAKAEPVATPAPPDFNFYKTRADAALTKGEFSVAVADYDKAVSLKADNPIAFMNRGKAHYNLKELSKAEADFNKSIELDPKDSRAYYNRGILNESRGELEKALADYKMAVDLDASNEPAKAMAKKVADQLLAQAKAVEKPAAPPEPVKVEPVVVKVPEFVNLGNLSAISAVKMGKPVYTAVAQKANIEGRVVVEVELDKAGEVVSAKAVSGHQFLRGSAEDAARKSTFPPAMFNGQPIKAVGVITYNFSLRPGK